MQVTFDAELYPWDAATKSSWVFVALPKDDADAIDDAVSLTGGFGSVKVNVQIGKSAWSTSLFPSKEEQTYVMPLKKAVRQAEGLEVGDMASITIEVVHL